MVLAQYLSLSSLQVNLLMYFEVSQHSEAFATLATAVGLQAAVEPLMSQAVVLSRKHLAADFATEWPLTRVHALVRLQPGLLRERFPAFKAPEWLRGLVRGSVLFQLRQARETPVADRADEEFLACFPNIYQTSYFCVLAEDAVFRVLSVCCRPLCMRRGYRRPVFSQGSLQAQVLADCRVCSLLEVFILSRL